MADIKAEIDAQVQKMHEVFVASASTKNLDEVLAFYTDDCRVLPPGAPMIEGKEGVKKLLGLTLQLMENVGKTENTVLDAVLMGEMASSIASRTTYDKDGKLVDDSKLMTIWKKVNGNWNIYWTAFNSNKPTPAQ